jgi:hypothetical protein
MRTVLFWAITLRIVVIPYRRFGTTYRSHLPLFAVLAQKSAILVCLFVFVFVTCRLFVLCRWPFYSLSVSRFCVDEGTTQLRSAEERIPTLRDVKFLQTQFLISHA